MAHEAAHFDPGLGIPQAGGHDPLLPVSTYLPSGEKATPHTSSVWPVKRRISTPVWASHRRAVRSLLAVSAYWPSGEKATDITSSVCPVKRRTSAPVCTSHRRAVCVASRSEYVFAVRRESHSKYRGGMSGEKLARIIQGGSSFQRRIALRGSNWISSRGC